MSKDYPKSDWVLFKSRIGKWQEAYMERLNQEYAEMLKEDSTSSDKFWGLVKRIDADRTKAGVMVEMKRSALVSSLVSLIREEAITMNDLEEFSAELKKDVKTIVEFL